MSPRLRNLTWIFVEKFGLIALSACSFLVCALFVAPAEWGRGVMVVAIVEFFGMVYGKAIEDPLVRQAQPGAGALRSAFWLGGLVSLVTALLLCAGGWWYQPEPWLLLLLGYGGLKLVASVMARPLLALLRRDKQFKAIAQRTLGGKLAGAAVGIAVAIIFESGAAIVAQAATMDLVALAVLLRSRPDWLFGALDGRAFVALVGEGGPAAIRALYKAAFSRGTPLVLGLAAGPATVGYFAFAQRLLNLPYEAVTSGLTNYALPVIADRLHRGAEVVRFSTMLSQATFAVMLPLFLTAGLVGGPLIPLIFGAQWLPAVVPFQVIAVTAALGGAVLYVPVIMLCYGRASIGLLADFLNTAATLAAIWFLGHQFGALGAALALLLRLLVDAAIQFWCLAHLRLFPLPAMARDYLATLFGVLPLLAGAGLLYGGAVTGLVQQLALGLGCGMLSVAMIALCSRGSVVSLRSLVTGEG